MQKRLFIIIIIFSIIFLKIGKVTAQDVHFSQFYANPVYLNPAFAGANVCPRIVTNGPPFQELSSPTPLLGTNILTN
jgi:hypothetical protein